jgi:hypothetical protein
MGVEYDDRGVDIMMKHSDDESSIYRDAPIEPQFVYVIVIAAFESRYRQVYGDLAINSYKRPVKSSLFEYLSTYNRFVFDNRQ